MIERIEEEIMKDWGVNNSDSPLVSVRCITYNHEKYIGQALDGFLMQKTSFPFEVIVHDDASTDKTAEIIREYERKFPHIIKPIYQTENQYSKRDGSLGRIVNAACKGKYIAFCEGDDYWIDENKLQMQVDFLENNPEYGMCYTKANKFFQENSLLGKSWGGSNTSFEKLLQRNTVPTLTVVVCNNLLHEYYLYRDSIKKKWLVGDYPLWLWLSKHSKIYFMNFITGVYRILNDSASHSSDITKRIDIARSINDMKIFFSEGKYDFLLDEFDANRECVRYYFSIFDRKNTFKYVKEIKKKSNKEKFIFFIVSNRLLFDIYKVLRTK